MSGHNRLRHYLVFFTFSLSLDVLAVPNLSSFGLVQWVHALFFHRLVWSLRKHCIQLALKLAYEAALQFLLMVSLSVIPQALSYVLQCKITILIGLALF